MLKQTDDGIYSNLIHFCFFFPLPTSTMKYYVCDVLLQNMKSQKFNELWYHYLRSAVDLSFLKNGFSTLEMTCFSKAFRLSRDSLCNEENISKGNDQMYRIYQV